jgi:hypothetical protein
MSPAAGGAAALLTGPMEATDDERDPASDPFAEFSFGLPFASRVVVERRGFRFAPPSASGSNF